MEFLNTTYLAEILFGMGLAMFCVTIYVIMPAFLYNKRTVFRPKLINAMWAKLFLGPMSRLNNKGAHQKKMEEPIKVTINQPLSSENKDKRLINKDRLY